jgi:hypothetical protein
MTEREKFLERWSRKKREVVDESTPSKPQDAEAEKTADSGSPVARSEAEKPFDLESLPSLESISAETDIRDFLRPGIPTDLRHEALRRVWSTDPGIRDFIGLAENSGDFNDPTAMAGFGPIEPSEVARLMAQFVLTPPEEKKVAGAPEQLDDQCDGDPEATLARPSPAVADDAVSDVAADAQNDVALQNDGTESDEPTPSADRASGQKSS